MQAETRPVPGGVVSEVAAGVVAAKPEVERPLSISITEAGGGAVPPAAATKNHERTTSGNDRTHIVSPPLSPSLALRTPSFERVPSSTSPPIPAPFPHAHSHSHSSPPPTAAVLEIGPARGHLRSPSIPLRLAMHQERERQLSAGSLSAMAHERQLSSGGGVAGSAHDRTGSLGGPGFRPDIERPSSVSSAGSALSSSATAHGFSLDLPGLLLSPDSRSYRGNGSASPTASSTMSALVIPGSGFVSSRRPSVIGSYLGDSRYPGVHLSPTHAQQHTLSGQASTGSLHTASTGSVHTVSSSPSSSGGPSLSVTPTPQSFARSRQVSMSELTVPTTGSGAEFLSPPSPMLAPYPHGSGAAARLSHIAKLTPLSTLGAPFVSTSGYAMHGHHSASPSAMASLAPTPRLGSPPPPNLPSASASMFVTQAVLGGRDLARAESLLRRKSISVSQPSSLLFPERSSSMASFAPTISESGAPPALSSLSPSPGSSSSSSAATSHRSLRSSLLPPVERSTSSSPRPLFDPTFGGRIPTSLSRPLANPALTLSAVDTAAAASLSMSFTLALPSTPLTPTVVEVVVDTTSTLDMTTLQPPRPSSPMPEMAASSALLHVPPARMPLTASVPELAARELGKRLSASVSAASAASAVSAALAASASASLIASPLTSVDATPTLTRTHTRFSLGGGADDDAEIEFDEQEPEVEVEVEAEDSPSSENSVSATHSAAQPGLVIKRTSLSTSANGGPASPHRVNQLLARATQQSPSSRSSSASTSAHPHSRNTSSGRKSFSNGKDSLLAAVEAPARRPKVRPPVTMDDEAVTNAHPRLQQILARQVSFSSIAPSAPASPASRSRRHTVIESPQDGESAGSAAERSLSKPRHGRRSVTHGSSSSIALSGVLGSGPHSHAQRKKLAEIASLRSPSRVNSFNSAQAAATAEALDAAAAAATNGRSPLAVNVGMHSSASAGKLGTAAQSRLKSLRVLGITERDLMLDGALAGSGLVGGGGRTGTTSGFLAPLSASASSPLAPLGPPLRKQSVNSTNIASVTAPASVPAVLRASFSSSTNSPLVASPNSLGTPKKRGSSVGTGLLSPTAASTSSTATGSTASPSSPTAARVRSFPVLAALGLASTTPLAAPVGGLASSKQTRRL